MTIWVNKTGADMNVGVTEKGDPGNGFSFNTDHVEATWVSDDTWRAWLYALGVTLTEADSFFVRINFTTPSTFANTGGPQYQYGMADISQTTHWINSTMGHYNHDSGTRQNLLLWEDDGTFHNHGGQVYAFATSTDYYITLVYDSVANTVTYKVYTAIDDTVRATLFLSTVGWAWDFDSVGLSNFKDNAHNGSFTEATLVTLIKANSGTTEEFIPTGLTSNRIMFIM